MAEKSKAKKSQTKKKMLLQKSTTDMTDNPQTESQLMSLAPELRNEIYELVARSESVQLQIVNHVRRRKGCRQPAGIALLLTCKQIHREAHDLVWDNLRFNITMYNAIHAACPFSHKFLEACTDAPILSKMRNISIHFEPERSFIGLERQDLKSRNEAIEKALIDNQAIKILQLESYGWDFYNLQPGESLQRTLAERGGYGKQFGKIIKALEARQIPVKLWNSKTAEMESAYSNDQRT